MQSKILFLSGVYKRDCKTIDDVVVEKFDDAEPVSETPQIIPLPDYYDKKIWPTEMTAPCPLCGVRASTPPLTVITFVSKIGNQHNGLQFNLPTCVAFFIQTFMNNDDKLKLNLIWFLRDLTGAKIYGEIITGIPPWQVRDFGVAKMSRAEWVRENEKLYKQSQLHGELASQGITHESVNIALMPPSEFDINKCEDGDEFDV